MKRRLDERSPLEKGLIGLLFVVSLALVGLAERDIQARPDEEIRGPKLAWRAASLNAFAPSPTWASDAGSDRGIRLPTRRRTRIGPVSAAAPRVGPRRADPPHPRVLLTEAHPPAGTYGESRSETLTPTRTKYVYEARRGPPDRP